MSSRMRVSRGGDEGTEKRLVWDCVCVPPSTEIRLRLGDEVDRPSFNLEIRELKLAIFSDSCSIAVSMFRNVRLMVSSEGGLMRGKSCLEESGKKIYRLVPYGGLACTSLA